MCNPLNPDYYFHYISVVTQVKKYAQTYVKKC